MMMVPWFTFLYGNDSDDDDDDAWRCFGVHFLWAMIVMTLMMAMIMLTSDNDDDA